MIGKRIFEVNFPRHVKMGKEAVSSLIYVTVAVSFNLPFSMHAKISKKNIFYKQIRSGTFRRF